MASRVTQRQVAAEAGVSVSTVSLVYSGSAKISAATRDRVRSVAARLGYRPTPGLSAAMSARWSAQRSQSFSRLGLILTRDPIQLSFSQSLLNNPANPFIEQAAELGYGVESITVTEQSPADLREELEFLRIDGLIFPMRTEIAPGLMEVLRSWPCVGMISRILGSGIPTVYPDLLVDAYRVFEQVARRGYRRTGLILARLPPSRGVLGSLGGLLAARHLHNSLNAPPLIQIEEGRFETAVDYLKTHQCDSVITGGSSELVALERLWPPINRLGRAALNVIDNHHAGVHFQRKMLYDCALNLLDSMVRGNLTGRDLANLREHIQFPWQDGSTLPQIDAQPTESSVE